MKVLLEALRREYYQQVVTILRDTDMLTLTGAISYLLMWVIYPEVFVSNERGPEEPALQYYARSLKPDSTCS